MKNGDYEFVRYRPEYRPQILRLQTHLWSSDSALNDSYFEWKYQDNPYTDTPLVFVALHQGTVVGMRGVYGAHWVAGDPPRHVLAANVGDLVVSRGHRGRLLFFPIMRAAFEELHRLDYRYLFGMSGSAVTQALSLRAGFHKLGEYSLMRRDGSLIGGPPERFSALPGEPRPHEMADLVASVQSGGRIRQLRDRRWFAWRFRNPLSDYRFLFAETNGRLDGYLVLQHSTKRPDEGLRIVDWEATTPIVREELLDRAASEMQPAPMSIFAATLCPDIVSLLERYEFHSYTRADGHRPGPLVRALGATDANKPIAGRNLLNLSDWELRMASTDSY